MASTLKKNSSVIESAYNNFIRDFVTYYGKYQKAIKDIVVNQVAKTVMVQNIWTDSYASEYANWFNDEKGVSDGCDKLNKAMVKMEALFKTTCFTPIKDVVKLIGDTTSVPMIQKAFKATDIYDVLNVQKYRKKNFPILSTKRKKGWTVTTNATKINQLMTNIEKDIKDIETIAEKIQTLVKRNVITPGHRCIEITGFNQSALNTTISEITTALTKFKYQSTQRAEAAISALNTTQDNIASQLSSVSEEN